MMFGVIPNLNVAPDAGLLLRRGRKPWVRSRDIF